MKQLKTISLAALAALALTASLAAGTASATTLEVGGVTKNESVTISGSLKSGTSAIFEDTSGISQNTCKKFEMHGATESPFSGVRVEGKATSWAYGECDRTITNHSPGRIYGEHIAGTTNATMFSKEAITTAGSPFGTLECVTGEGTHIGTVTGVASGHATVHVNAIIDCGISARLTATGTITSPTGIGGSA
jgi:hypothetical protein